VKPSPEELRHRAVRRARCTRPPSARALAAL
jgi:hypothetical protein